MKFPPASLRPVEENWMKIRTIRFPTCAFQDGVEEAYHNGEETDIPTDIEGGSVVIGEAGGIEIEVVVGPDGEIISAYPSAGQEGKGVKENPPAEEN